MENTIKVITVHFEGLIPDQIPNIPTELRNISDDVLQASVSSPFQLSRCESGDEALKSHNSSRITIFISRGDTQVYYNMTWC